MHCIAAVYGPMAPANTGVVAVQRVDSEVRGWRISGTGVVLELDADFRWAPGASISNRERQGREGGGVPTSRGVLACPSPVGSAGLCARALALGGCLAPFRL
eukprot:312650-Chlamydomonas_euryale.AAC.1